tara:strand:- start:598 stop:1158 length:561 start_codon:yes stop_codon:yes gene_type:complete
MAEVEFQENVIHINRVAKVVKGGRNFAFTALVAVGDGKGNAGIGYGKGSEVPLAIQKAIENAKKNVNSIPMAGSTIVHAITGEHGSSKVLLKPAAPGTGVIAGGAARQVLEVAGVKDILAKSLGSPTHLNVAKATMNGLLNQRTPDKVAALRGKKPSEIAPQGLVDAFEKTKAERKTDLKVKDGES